MRTLVVVEGDVLGEGSMGGMVVLCAFADQRLLAMRAVHAFHHADGLGMSDAGADVADRFSTLSSATARRSRSISARSAADGSAFGRPGAAERSAANAPARACFSQG